MLGRDTMACHVNLTQLHRRDSDIRQHDAPRRAALVELVSYARRMAGPVRRTHPPARRIVLIPDPQ